MRAPLSGARTFYAQHRDFHGQDPRHIKGWLTPAFYAALQTEYRCARGVLCALEMDPWLAAQDGDIDGAPRFTLQQVSPARAEVTMRYRFALPPQPSVPRSVRLVLHRGGSGCWLLDDLIMPDGQGLRPWLERWHAAAGATE